jgi:hypothetical protein
MKTTRSTPTDTVYENNPVYIATNGLDMLFRRATGLALTLALFAGVFFSQTLPTFFTDTGKSNSTSTTDSQAFRDAVSQIPAGAWLFIVLVLLVGIALFLAFVVVIRGLIDYTSAKIANGEEATLTEAVKAVFGQFWGYAWVQLITTVKIFLWTLLFIIPGIIMAVRYSLAGVAFFGSDLKGNQAVTHSSRLVKGAWLTTFAAQNLLNIVTFGTLSSLLTAGTNAVLYRQLSTTPDDRPSAHKLSWLTLLIPIVVVIVVFFVIGILASSLSNFLHVQK